MPKDWDAYKAELKRLYITEERPLLEIQKTLEDRGFKASVRAYRMRFDEWGFRKYKLKKRTRLQILPTISQTAVAGPNKVVITISDSDSDGDYHPIAKRARRLDSTIPPGKSQQNHPTGGITNERHSADPINIPEDIAMLSIGRFMIPRWPTSREHLFSYLPQASGLQLFALLRTWRRQSFHMESLKDMIHDHDTHRFFFHSSEKANVGGDHFELDNIFEYAKALVDPGDLPQVYSSLLLGLSLSKFLPDQSPLWAVAWRNAANACTWEVARIFLLYAEHSSPATNDIIESSKGEILILKSVLEHHHGILNHDRECEREECDASASRHLKREYLQMVDRLQTFESHVHPKFNRFGIKIALSVMEAEPEENNDSPDLLRKTEDKEDKYRRVISKYAGVKIDKVDEELQRLLEANKDDEVSPQELFSNFETFPEADEAGQTTSPTVPSISSIAVPVENDSAPSNSKRNEYSPDTDFLHLVYLEWRSGTKTLEISHKFKRNLLRFEEIGFEPLFNWTRDRIASENRIPFLAKISQAFLRLYVSPDGVEKGLLRWDRIRQLILQAHVPVLGSKYQWPELKYPECALQLFGELYLASIQAFSRKSVHQNEKIHVPQHYQWVQIDFLNWGIEVKPTLKASFPSSS